MAPLLAFRRPVRGPSPLIEHGRGGRLDRIPGHGVDILAGLVDLVLRLLHTGTLLVQGRIGVLPGLFQSRRLLVQHVRGVFLHLGIGLLLLLAHQLVGIAVALDPQGGVHRLVPDRLVEVALGLEHAGLRTGRQQTQGEAQNPCTHHHFLSFKTGKSGSI